MKFAFLIMGDFNVESDRAEIHGGNAVIVGVKNIEESAVVARQLQKEGFGCIELCGAFGEKGAKKIIKATENKLPIGYITHLPEQNELYNTTFKDSPTV